MRKQVRPMNVAPRMNQVLLGVSATGSTARAAVERGGREDEDDVKPYEGAIMGVVVSKGSSGGGKTGKIPCISLGSAVLVFLIVLLIVELLVEVVQVSVEVSDDFESKLQTVLPSRNGRNNSICGRCMVNKLVAMSLSGYEWTAFRFSWETAKDKGALNATTNL